MVLYIFCDFACHKFFEKVGVVLLKQYELKAKTMKHLIIIALMIVPGVVGFQAFDSDLNFCFTYDHGHEDRKEDNK